MCPQLATDSQAYESVCPPYRATGAVRRDVWYVVSSAPQVNYSCYDDSTNTGTMVTMAAVAIGVSSGMMTTSL